MSAPAPLTHHQILARVAPFARRGWRVDLAATDRMAGRIVFQPRAHPAEAGRPALLEHCVLARGEAGTDRLERRLLPEQGGPEATLTLEAADPERLLAALDAVPPSAQFEAGPGWQLALSHRQGRNGADGLGPLQLVRGEIATGGLSVTLKVPTVSGISADLLIADTAVQLPDDLLEVLGRGWGRLDRGVGGWTAPVGLAGRGEARYRDAEARLRRLAAHLAQTLAEPPARYRERLRAARWRVAARRTLPLAGALGLVAAATVVPSLGLSRESPVWMLVFNAPPLLLVLFFSLREMPRIVLPRPPQGPPDDAWPARPGH